MSSTPLYVYVDVDDTLVRSAGSKRIPITAVIEHIRALKREGAVLYCWSAGGASYAQESAKEFAVEDCFEGFLPKPNIILDDAPVNLWPGCATVHPAGCNLILEEYRRRLENPTSD